MKPSSTETAARRADVIAHRVTVVKAYRSGRSMNRVASDWEVAPRWLTAQFAAWGESLRPESRPGQIQVTVVVVDATGRIILVKRAVTTGPRGWRLPGGWARKNEPIADVAARELREQLNIVRTLTHVAALDQSPADPLGRRHLVVVFVTSLTSEETALFAANGASRLLCAVMPDHLDDHVAPYDAQLVRASIRTVRRGHELPLGTGINEIA